MKGPKTLFLPLRVLRGDFRGKRRTKSVDDLTTCSSKFTANLTANGSGSQDYTTFPANCLTATVRLRKTKTPVGNKQQCFGLARQQRSSQTDSNGSGSQDHNVPNKLTAIARVRKTTTFPANYRFARLQHSLQEEQHCMHGSGSQSYTVLYK